MSDQEPLELQPVAVATTVAVDPRRRRLRRPVVAGLAAAVLAAAMVAGGVAVHADRANAASTSTSVADRGPFGGFGGYGGYGPAEGYGPSGGYGSSGADQSQSGQSQLGQGDSDGSSSSGSSSGQSAATTATTAQQVGVVTIVSTLGYENGESAGTGMILTSDGYVLTNNHVIDGATSIQVTVGSTGTTYTATVVGTDPGKDVAVLKLTGASGLSTVTVDRDGVSTGESITAIGNAEGIGTLVAAAGTVTATDQTMTASESGSESETLSGMIEISAAVVAGDSGGPVQDAQGEVVGITTAASSGTGDTTAYAIDIDNALTIVKQIEAGRSGNGVTLGYPAFLGVSVASSSQASASDEQGSFGSSSTSGATVAGVISGTPAASAGLAAGDVITKVGSTTISTADELSSALATDKVGAKVTITWVSGTTGETQTATVTLAQGPAN